MKTLKLLALYAAFACACFGQLAIAITPAAIAVAPGGTAEFTVVVTGVANVGSTSTIAPNVGTLTTVIAGALDKLTYTAPADAAAQVVTVTSAAHADPTVTVESAITITGQPALLAVYSWLPSPYGSGASSLAIWAEGEAVPVGVTCSVTWVAATTGVDTYSGAASISGFTPAVLMPVVVANGDTLAGAPLVTMSCPGADVVSLDAVPI